MPARDTTARDPLAGPLTLRLAWRFLRGRHSHLMSSAARSALTSTTLGVMAMVIAMALMTGYRGDLQRKLVSGNAAVVAYPLAAVGGADPAAWLETARALPGVTGAQLVAYGQGVLAAGDGREAEVTLRGIDPGPGLLGATPEQLATGANGVPGVVLGSELAATLGVKPGDAVRLTALALSLERPRFAFRTLRCTGVFRSGFSEFDRAWAVAARGLVAGLGTGSRSLELAVEDPEAAPAIAARLGEALGADFLVTDWQELNHELFTALRLQQIGLFLLLGLIVLVSTFNVASTLVVLVRERRRDLAVLAALGLAPADLRRVFVLHGGALGVLGTALGLALGSAISWVLTTFELIRFDPGVAEIYFLSSVPFHVEARDLAAVAVFSLGVTFAACWLAARRAASFEPATALRYE